MSPALFYESFIAKLNAFGRYQKLRVILLQLVIITIPLCSLTSIFSLQSVDYKCSIDSRDKELYKSLSEEDWEKLVYPPSSKLGGQLDYCRIYDFPHQNTSSNVSKSGKDETVACGNFTVAHKYDREVTATSDFEIFCDKEAFRQTGTALLFLGKTVGLMIGGQVSDMFGRKPLLVLFQILLILATASFAFAPNLQIFLVGRFLIGFSYATNYLLVFTLVCEMLLPKHLVLLGFVMEASFGVGLSLLAVVAFIFQNWRHLQIAVAIAGIPSVLICIWAPESLRWLVSSGNFNKARILAQKIAKSNNVEFDLCLEDELFVLCQSFETSKVKSAASDNNNRFSQQSTLSPDVKVQQKVAVNLINQLEQNKSEQETQISEHSQILFPAIELTTTEVIESNPVVGKLACKQDVDNSTYSKHFLIIQIFKTPKLRTRVLVLAYCWAVISAIYYGISLGGSMIPGSLYVNTVVGGLVEIPAMITAYIIATRFGRKWLLVYSLILAGLSCSLIAVTSSLQNGDIGSQILAQCGKFGITICYGVIYVYTIELIPTCVRTTGMSFCSTSARISSIITPYAALLSQLIWEPLGFLIYGVLAVSAGLLAVYLPETLNKSLQDTCEDAMKFANENEKCPHPGIVHVEATATVMTADAVPHGNFDELALNWREDMIKSSNKEDDVESVSDDPFDQNKSDNWVSQV